VFAKSGEGHGKGLSNIGDAGRAASEAVDDGAASAVGDGGGDGIEMRCGRTMVNHVVQYSMSAADCQRGAGSFLSGKSRAIFSRESARALVLTLSMLASTTTPRLRSGTTTKSVSVPCWPPE
jgi:hypothetical protein